MAGTKLKLKNRINGGAYFLDQSSDNEFVPSGCAVLDRVLGGGWALSRIANIVGDKAVGKTLLALEACINFQKYFPKGWIRYREPEAALARGYAQEMGVDVKNVEWDDDLTELDTVEDWHEDLDNFLDELGKDEPGLYILDSLDALTSEAEKKRSIREASFGGEKPKKMGELFRKLVRKIKRKRVLVLVISQVRDNIGVAFGEKHTRTGGKALDFYASQIIWLANMGQIHRTINKVQRTIGNKVKVRCKKNKVGLSFRDCDLDVRFGYGIDDVASNVKFLASVGKQGLIKVGLGSDPGKITGFLHDLEGSSEIEFKRVRDKLNRIVPEVWKQVESAFLPTRRKY
jgi:recombination protein RecA